MTTKPYYPSVIARPRRGRGNLDCVSRPPAGIQLLCSHLVIPAKAGIQVLLVVILLIALAGCVERTITVRTDPPGALVTVNEVEKGRTPVTFPFTWYGDYRVLVESPEYETLETHQLVSAPIYQWPVLDFISEIILPFNFHDHHDWQFTLSPRPAVDPDALIDRAKDFRQQTETPAD